MHTQNLIKDASQRAENPPSRTLIRGHHARMSFLPRLFGVLRAENMVYDWMRANSDYDGGHWNYFDVPAGITGCVKPWAGAETVWTGYMAPDSDAPLKMCIPGNYFEAEVSADAAGIIATLMVLNQLSWMLSEKGKKYDRQVRELVARQDALKDYTSITRHPEAGFIFRAID